MAPAETGAVFSLLLQLMLVLLAAKLCSVLLQRLGQPEVLGEIIAGVILGPSLLNVLEPNIVFSFLAEFGVILLLFEVGLEIDVRTLMQVGRRSAVIAVGDILVPFVLTYLLGRALGLGGFASLFLGAIFSATSIGLSIRVLSDLGKMGTIETMAVLSTAMYDDIASMLMISVFLGLVETGALDLLVVARTVLVSISFLLLTLLVGTKVTPRLIDRIAGLPVRGGLLVFAVVLGISTSYLASLAGLAPIIGAFIAGMLLAGSRQKEVIIEDLTPLGHILAPVFFVLIGAAVNVKSIVGLLPLGLVFILVAVAGKVAGCASTALIAGFDRYQALIIGLSMIPRGEISLILARSRVEQGLIDPNLYALIVFTVLGSTLLTPIFLKSVFKHLDRPQKPPAPEET